MKSLTEKKPRYLEEETIISESISSNFRYLRSVNNYKLLVFDYAFLGLIIFSTSVNFYNWGSFYIITDDLSFSHGAYGA